MLTGGRMEVRSIGARVRMQTELASLRAQWTVLSEACVVSRQTAALARQEAIRVRAASQRSRGELVRAWLPRDATCGILARRLVEEHLGADGASAPEIGDVKSVVSELVINAFLHGSGRIELRVSSRRGRARVEVIDQGNAVAFRAGVHETGHGLEIVRALSLVWGVRGRATLVWAELPAGRTGGRSAVDAPGTHRPAPSWLTWMSAALNPSPSQRGDIARRRLLRQASDLPPVAGRRGGTA
jgi:hypothetical protein